MCYFIDSCRHGRMKIGSIHHVRGDMQLRGMRFFHDFRQ
jgi:hypothetical protein